MMKGREVLPLVPRVHFATEREDVEPSIGLFTLYGFSKPPAFSSRPPLQSAAAEHQSTAVEMRSQRDDIVGTHSAPAAPALTPVRLVAEESARTPPLYSLRGSTLRCRDAMEPPRHHGACAVHPATSRSRHSEAGSHVPHTCFVKVHNLRRARLTLTSIFLLSVVGDRGGQSMERSRARHRCLVRHHRGRPGTSRGIDVGVMTRTDGTYRLSIAPGRYELRVSRIGYAAGARLGDRGVLPSL